MRLRNMCRGNFFYQMWTACLGIRMLEGDTFSWLEVLQFAPNTGKDKHLTFLHDWYCYGGLSVPSLINLQIEN